MTFSRPLDKIAAGLAFVLGLVTILGALGSQFIGGLQPCELCLEQRLPYYWGLPLLALILILWNRLPLTVWYVAMAIVAALFAWGA
jgi:disulfide bond formation protein DsbB